MKHTMDVKSLWCMRRPVKHRAVSPAGNRENPHLLYIHSNTEMTALTDLTICHHLVLHHVTGFVFALQSAFLYCMWKAFSIWALWLLEHSLIQNTAKAKRSAGGSWCSETTRHKQAAAWINAGITYQPCSRCVTKTGNAKHLHVRFRHLSGSSVTSCQ